MPVSVFLGLLIPVPENVIDQLVEVIDTIEIPDIPIKLNITMVNIGQ